MILLSSSTHFTAVNHHHHHYHHRLISYLPTSFFFLNLHHKPSPLNLQLTRKQPSCGRPVSSSAAAILSGAWVQDGGATAAVLVGGYGVVRIFNTLTSKMIIQQDSTSTNARYFASIVPLLNCLRLLVNGLSLTSDEGLIKSLTREGKPEELLRGPLYYVLVLIVCALYFWRDSPIGILSVAMMCGGDGIADIMGRKFGATKLPYNQHKSFAGSISMFVFGFLVSTGMLYYYSYMGYFQLEWVQTTRRIALVSLVATLVESLPINNVIDDNISVPLSTAVAAYFTFGL
ncbi:hypothetical protein ACFE04_002607 [Oxalis oulophora]